MDSQYNKKRINPPIWQHDFHVLKKLYFLLEHISLLIPPSSHIVDYGCGTSPYENLFRKNKGNYLKIDIGRNKNADIIVKEDQSLPLKNSSIDIVLSTQVLEHVNNLPLYLSEAQRILKKGGYLILSTHGIWPYHPSPSDYYRFTDTGLKHEVEKYGFRTLKFYKILGPFASLTQFTLLLIAEKLKGANILTRLILAVVSIVGNSIIWLENLIFPPGKNSDAAVFLLWAEKK